MRDARRVYGRLRAVCFTSLFQLFASCWSLCVCVCVNVCRSHWRNVKAMHMQCPAKPSVEPNRRQIDSRPALMTNRLELVGMRNGDYRKLKAMKLIRHKECCSIECGSALVCVCACM